MEFNISRYKDIEKITYECEVVTPMFLSGANQREAELRTQSIKGALRFWWRALYGSDDIEDMKKKESEIFGNTEKKSKISINVDDIFENRIENLPKGKNFTVESTKKAKVFTLGIIDYLAYGLHDYQKGRNIYNRSFINSGKNFKINFKIDSRFREEILNSFNILIDYGGLGARSRNGFGSISCKDCEKINIKDFFIERVKKYTAFNSDSWIKTFDKHNSWIDALSEIGLKYREARLSLERKHSFERRGLVAKPIEVKGEKIPHEIRNERQAKTYFLSVNKVDNKYVGKILFLPYEGDRNYESVNEDMKKIITGGKK